MASLFIIGADRQWEEEELLRAAVVAGFKATFLLASDLVVTERDVTHEGVSIAGELQTSRIIFRRARGALATMVALAALADVWGVPHADSLESIRDNLDKTRWLPTLPLRVLQAIPTVVVSADALTVALPFSCPVVAKPATGRHGEGIVFLEQEADMRDWAQKKRTEDFLLQPLLAIDAEYRVFVVGEAALGCVRKIRAEGQRVANYAAGASFEAANLSSAFVEESIALCRHLGIDIGGVDLAQVGEKFFVLEINRCPEFRAFQGATGIDVAAAIIPFVARL